MSAGSRLRDDERAVLQRGGPLIVAREIELGDLLDAADECGIEWENLQMSAVSVASGVAVEVNVLDALSHFVYLHERPMSEGHRTAEAKEVSEAVNHEAAPRVGDSDAGSGAGGKA